MRNDEKRYAICQDWIIMKKKKNEFLGKLLVGNTILLGFLISIQTIYKYNVHIGFLFFQLQKNCLFFFFYCAFD